MNNDEDDNDIASIGARIGRRLAATKTSITQPAIAARLFADAVLAQHPAVKLPELIADGEVKRWLEARSLGDGQLRHALTEARRALRGKRDERAVRRTPRRRGRIADIAAPTARSAAELAASAVPNRALSDL